MGCFSRSDEWESISKHLRLAERHQRKEEYADAITAYKLHIDHRLALEQKPEWENPYFYYLIIGDLYLKEDLYQKALESYRFADSKKVDSGLVSDRYRLVAKWLADKERFSEAIDLLNTYRETDPLLYDMMRDRIAREMVQIEEESLLNEEKPE